MDARHRRRQRLGQRRVRVRNLSRIDLGEELEDARTTLGGLVEVDVEVGDALDPQAFAEHQKSGKTMPALHSAHFAPLPEPTLKTGLTAMTEAALELLH